MFEFPSTKMPPMILLFLLPANVNHRRLPMPLLPIVLLLLHFDIFAPPPELSD